MHDFRHHYLSWLANIGVGPTDVLEIGGHKDMLTAQKYMHSSPDYLSRARELMNRAEGGGQQTGQRPKMEEPPGPRRAAPRAG
jgi:hypothetical protein